MTQRTISLAVRKEAASTWDGALLVDGKFVRSLEGRATLKDLMTSLDTQLLLLEQEMDVQGVITLNMEVGVPNDNPANSR